MSWLWVERPPFGDASPGGGVGPNHRFSHMINLGFFRALANIGPTGHAATPLPLGSRSWDRCQKMPQHFYFRQEPGLIVLTSAPPAQGPRRGGGVGQNADFLNLPAPSWPRPASNVDVPHVKRKVSTRAFRGCPWNSSRSHPAGVATSGKSSKKVAFSPPGGRFREKFTVQRFQPAEN